MDVTRVSESRILNVLAFHVEVLLSENLHNVWSFCHRCSEQTESVCLLFVIVADEFDLSAIFGRFLDQVASRVVFTAPPNFAAIKFAVSHGNAKLLSPGRTLQIGEQNLARLQPARPT